MTERTARDARAERKRILTEYARARLTEECSPRGKQSEIADRLGFSTAHLTNVLKNGHGMGEELIASLGEYWDLSRDEFLRKARAWERRQRAREAS